MWVRLCTTIGGQAMEKKKKQVEIGKCALCKSEVVHLGLIWLVE